MSTTLKKVKMRKDAKTITEEAVYGNERLQRHSDKEIEEVS